MLNLINNRPVVLSLLVAVLAFIFLVTYGLLTSSHIFDYFYAKMPLFLIATLLFAIPIFVSATQNTAKIDLVDPDTVRNLREYYKKQNNYFLSPFLMIFSRLFLELADQRSHATKNLSLGVGFTFIAVSLSVFLIITTQSGEVQALDIQKYLASFLLPKITVIVFIESIAMFFLRWYRRSLARISEISAQILDVEFKLLAHHVDRQPDSPNRDELVLNILKTVPLSPQDQSRDTALFDKEVLKKLIDRISINIANKSK